MKLKNLKKKMKKEDRYIEWINYNGYCKGEKVFQIWCGGYYYDLYLVFPNYLICKLNSYSTLRDAELDAERFLKRLQQVVK